MSFKIIKKITLAPSNEPFLRFANHEDTYSYFVILSADVIQGEFIGYGKLRRWQGDPESRLEYQKLGESLDNIYRSTTKNWPMDKHGNYLVNDDLIPFPPPYDEMTDDYEDIPIPVPPETQVITLCIAPHDTVSIHANVREEYVIVDDNGNEIPLEDLLGGKKQSASP